MESIQQATNTDGDIYTLVVADDVHTLITFEACTGKVLAVILNFLPEIQKWAELVRYPDGTVESNLVSLAGGQYTVDMWNDLQDYADKIVGE